MADPFHNCIDPKERRTSKNYVAPTKEQATTGRYSPAGDYYGVGYRTPPGKFAPSSYSNGPIPLESKCMNPNEWHFKD